MRWRARRWISVFWARFPPRRALLVEAPCGYGKSHAVLSALSTVPGAACWLSLTPQENAPARLLTLLSLALDTPGILDSALQGGAGFADALAMMLVSVGRNAACEQRVLVLDNLDHLSNPAAAELVSQLVRNLPESLTLVLISRCGRRLKATGWNWKGALLVWGRRRWSCPGLRRSAFSRACWRRTG